MNLSFYKGGETRTENIITCGYSPIAIVFSIALGCLILLITISAGLKKVNTAVPTGGTCSAVVSAACHRPSGDKNAALELVKWGVVRESNGGRIQDHCCITSWPVEVPKQGRYYR